MQFISSQHNVIFQINVSKSNAVFFQLTIKTIINGGLIIFKHSIDNIIIFIVFLYTLLFKFYNALELQSPFILILSKIKSHQILNFTFINSFLHLFFIILLYLLSSPPSQKSTRVRKNIIKI